MEPVGRPSTRPRSSNKCQVLQALLRHGQTSRQHIAELTKLTPATITNLTAELIAENLVRESGHLEESGRRAGRKFVAIQLNGEACQVAAVHISFSGVELALVQLDGLLRRRHTYTFAPGTDAAGFTSQLVLELERFLAGEERTVLAIGIGCVGLISFEEGRILNARHLGWVDIPLVSALSEHFRLPVYLENNARAMALAEKMYGQSKFHADFLCVYVGRGIGAGLIVHDKLYRGGPTGAGEFGHMTYEPDGIPCWCGNRGCIERYASHSALQVQLSVDSWDEAAALLEQGDPRALEAVRMAGKRIGTVLASIVNIMHIPKVVIAGALSLSPQYAFVEEMRKEVNARSFLTQQGKVSIEASALGASIGVMGAASVALDQEIFRF